MAPYYPIQICRSDGMLEVTAKNGIRETNQPTTAQLNDAADGDGVVDCYRRLADDDAKAVDWRRKLGGMLMHLLGGKEHADRNYILKELPEGYVLWEHVKYKVEKLTEGKREKGKHAAGIYERQDAYLYGHPEGRRKRYRSPADFFPHMLWLAVDKEGDSRNCSCKMCSPDGEEDPQENALKEEAVVKRETKVALPVSIPPKAAASKPTFTPAPGAAKSPEQELDSEPNGKYLYRPGELVWYNKGLAWGLAVISKRQTLNGRPRYLVQPLSHPLHHPDYQIKDQEDAIRPWLAWSVPAATHAAIAHMTFDQVLWGRLLRGDFGPGDAQVDGSILAAKAIDGSYSLFDRIETLLAQPGEVYYNGMFLGAEKIWTGEPLRLRGAGDEIVVLIISKLIEHTMPNGATSSTVTFVGDVYKFVEMPMPYRSRAEWPTRSDLPARMATDLRFRNEVSDAVRKGMWYDWRLLETTARKGLADVKGRWYETRTLLPILRGAQQFQQEMSQGITSDAGLWMNARGDSSSPIGQRKKNRKDTLGGAVPADFKVSRGLDGSQADDLFPDMPFPQDSQKLHQPVQPKYTENDIDQFMDLDQTSGSNEFYGGAM